MNTGSDGKVTGRAETLAELKTMKWNTAEYTDLKVTVFGDTAIATGDFKSKGTDAAGNIVYQARNVRVLWVVTD